RLFRDTSLILDLLTSQHGIQSAVVRGIRVGAQRHHERAAVAGFHRLTVDMVRRRSDGLATMTAIEIDCAHHYVPVSHGAALLAAQLAQEVAWRLLPAADPHLQSFQLLDQLWHNLSQGEEPLVAISCWLVAFLHGIGYGWRMERCVGCGTTEALVYFSVRRGQPVCQLCGAPWHDRLWPLSEPLRRVMAGLDRIVVDEEIKSVLPSTAEWWRLYQIGMASLCQHGGVVLLGDIPFRQMVAKWGESMTGEHDK
ncbi:MAG: DNA repair protein RecO, partial [Magnetococcales bacterium]|nr:DNA repair protein RecO [Magnetococcales bacterium]